MDEEVPRRRGGVRLVAVAAIAWWITLGLMAALTANPVMLNRNQIRGARLVLEGSVTNTTSGRIKVSRHWLVDWISPVPENPMIENLSECFPAPESNRRYLFPLIPTGEKDTFHVVQLPRQSGSDLPLIYPSDASTVKQVDAMTRPDNQ
jgi:hypothetical protein